MPDLLSIFANNLLPIFLCAGAGYAVGRTFQPDVRTASRLTFYIFSPCLVYASLSDLGFSPDFWRMGAFVALTTVIKLGLAALAGLALRLPRPQWAALMVLSAFVNTGNYGLAAVNFAFGEAALGQAVIFYVFSTVMVYTLGVGVASWGQGSWRQAATQMFRVPAFYAFALSGFAHAFNVTLPMPLERAVALLGQASIPVMLVLLGLHMAEVTARPHVRWPVVALALAMQLGVAPLLALGAAHLLGLSGPAWQAAVLQAAMPTAVIVTVLATEYDLDQALITTSVILSTLLSPLTLAPLMAYLQG